MKTYIRALVPEFLLNLYHLSLAYLGAVLYRFPSRELTVIAVTGTKGKSSTTEMLNAILEVHGYTTALSNSIRTKIAHYSKASPGRSTPGRFFLQRFLRHAIQAGCSHAVIELTSEGARQSRHRAIALDALVFTNIAPEHLESHGSFAAYADAKFSIALSLVHSEKRPRALVVNRAYVESARYLALPIEKKIGFLLAEHAPFETGERGGYFTLEGTRINVQFPGTFSLENALAAAKVARAFGVELSTIARALSSLSSIPGRAERVDEGQNFTVIVDYAHTPDSLQALIDAYPGEKICVLGSAGGGRDTWKRPVVGKIAENHCAHVILTNDDPYDEDPEKILHEIAAGMQKEPIMIQNRRKAIRKALSLARPGSTVLITGKGIDPIGGPGGVKIPWNDVDVTREELRALIGGTV